MQPPTEERNRSAQQSGGATSVGLFSRTMAVIRVATRRRDSQLVLVASTIGYLVVYLFAIGDFTLTGGNEVAMVVVDDPLARMVEPVGFTRYEAAARIDVVGITALLSPINLLVALGLSVPIGVNFSLTYLGLVQPRACGLEAPSSVLAGIPTLLSGAACCGPVVLLALGIQASGILITGFQLLVPIAVVLLIGSLLLVGRQVDPSIL